MELGKYLVQELEFEDSFDTLGRWMSHHVAELIHQAENGVTKADQIVAEKRATEVILKIWEHRTALPGKAYPLAAYKDILDVLQHLKPSNNPFRQYTFGQDENDLLASRLFDCLTRLTIALLLMRLTSISSTAQMDSTVKKHLDNTERKILFSLEYWLELMEIEKSQTVKLKSKVSKKKKTDSIGVEIVLKLIAQTNQTLADLQKRLDSLEGTRA